MGWGSVLCSAFWLPENLGFCVVRHLSFLGWDQRGMIDVFWVISPGRGSADVESRFEGGFSGFLVFGTIPRRKASGHKINLTRLFVSPFWCRCGCF
jgi:hypothetical protein